MLTVDRESFLPALRLAESVLPRSEMLARLDATVKEATLTAWHQPDKLALTLPVKPFRLDADLYSEAGAFTANLQAGLLANLLDRLSDQEIVLARVKGDLVLRTNAGRFQFAPYDHDHEVQPVSVPAEWKPTHVFDAPLLREALARAAPAAAAGNARYALTGILLDGASCIATDGGRLVIAEAGPTVCQALGEHPEIPTPVLPNRAVALLQRLLADRSGPVEVQLGKPTYIRVGSALISTALVEGRYPPYRDVLPKPERVKHRVQLPLPQLLLALRQMALWTNEESRGIDFSFGEGTLTLRAKHYLLGRAELSLPVPGAAPFPEFILAGNLLIQCLAAPLPSEITLHLVDPNSAAHFTCPGWQMLLMPLVAR